MSKKRIPSQEMLDDLSRMGDQDFMSKWEVSRIVPIKLRRRYGIQPFNNQHGTVEHKFENGTEYKYCGSCESWKPLDSFTNHSSRWDGLRSSCKDCEKGFPSNNKGRKSYNTRRHNSIRRNAYISWTKEDELKIYELCGNSCAYCKTPIALDDVEFDHFIPVKLGGMTEPNNMLPSCSTCNRGRCGKFNKHPVEWLVQKFGQHFGEIIYSECLSILEKV